MKHPTPDPPELGERDGLSYALFLPDSEPSGGVVILHGAGSAKESHYDFGRLCRAYDMAAVAYDARGHGRSAGEWGPTAFGDALAMCDLLREHAPKVALRGSSMGGFTAIHAAALDPSVAAVVAMCPGRREMLRGGCGRAGISEFAVDPAAEAVAGGAGHVRGGAASLGESTQPCCCYTRKRRRAGPLHRERGAARGGARAQAPAGVPRRPPPIPAARPRGPEHRRPASSSGRSPKR